MMGRDLIERKKEDVCVCVCVCVFGVWRGLVHYAIVCVCVCVCVPLH